LVDYKEFPLGCSEACVEIPTWYNWIWVVSGGEVRLEGYTDFDWVGSVVDRLSTSGSCFRLGSSTIYGIRKNPNSIALGTIETEYIISSVAIREAV
jgi:hypothetical protein